MQNLGCMTTGEHIVVDSPVRDDDVVVVVQRGKIIGVLSEAAQEGAQTVRMTFTRNSEKDSFMPLQGTTVACFEKTHVDAA